ncbi:unnamed protein product [Prunus brigantina]
MAFVIVMLNSYSLSLPVPSQPFDMSLGTEGNSRATGIYGLAQCTPALPE